jgi:hypothetical protein
VHLLRVGKGPLCSAHSAASGDRPKKAQQCDELFSNATREAFKERSWQALLIDRWHERCRGYTPERARRKDAEPPLAPTHNRATAHSHKLREPVQSRGRPVSHCRDQDDHAGDIHLAAEEAERRRRLALATIASGTAKAETAIVTLTEPSRSASRFAGVLARMQHTAAAHTCPRSGGGCKITVECEEKLMEFGIRQKCLIQEIPSFLAQGRDRDGQYRTQ